MEEVVLSKRQQGKTRMLIEMCHADKYSLIVCPNRAMCELTFKMAQDLKMPIPMPITFEVFARRTWSGRNINNFYFDELQMSLQSIAGHTQIKTVVIDTTYSRVGFLELAKEKMLSGKYELRCFEPVHYTANQYQSIEYYDSWLQMFKSYRKKKKQYAKVDLIVRKTLKE